MIQPSKRPCKLRIKNHDPCLPAYNKGHTFDAGIDLYCAEDTILPGITVIGDPIKVTRVPTNISVAIPVGYVGDIRPKSGLSSKGWLIHYGTVDSGYRGLIQVNVSNLSLEDRTFKKGDKLAQLVLLPLAIYDIEIVDELPPSVDDRGEGGFGSTGEQ